LGERDLDSSFFFEPQMDPHSWENTEYGDFRMVVRLSWLVGDTLLIDAPMEQCERLRSITAQDFASSRRNGLPAALRGI